MSTYYDTLKGVLFDLDGVITNTAMYHYQAWKQIADELNIHFDEEINEQLKGVSRMDSLNIILRNGTQQYTEAEKLELATKKNEVYKGLLTQLQPTDILPGAREFIHTLRKDGKKIALGSASKNALTIINRLQIEDLFDEIVCGLDVTHSKPHPEVFLVGAERLGLEPQVCCVVEDAAAGIDAAIRAGMKSIGIGNSDLNHATIRIRSTSELSIRLFDSF